MSLPGRHLRRRHLVISPKQTPPSRGPNATTCQGGNPGRFPAGVGARPPREARRHYGAEVYAVAVRRLARKELRQYPIPLRWWGCCGAARGSNEPTITARAGPAPGRRWSVHATRIALARPIAVISKVRPSGTGCSTPLWR